MFDPFILYYFCAKTNSVWAPVIISILVEITIQLSVAAEKFILLFNPVIYDTADVISTYVYRKDFPDISATSGNVMAGIICTISGIILLGFIIFFWNKKKK